MEDESRPGKLWGHQRSNGGRGSAAGRYSEISRAELYHVLMAVYVQLLEMMLCLN